MSAQAGPQLQTSPVVKFSAWTLWAVATVCSLVGIAMIPFTHHLRHYLQVMPQSMTWIMLPLEIASSAVFLVFAAVGLLMLLRQPQNRMSLWAMAIGLAGGLNTLSGNYTLLAYVVSPGGWWPLAPLAAWIQHWMTLAATAIGIFFIPLLFPDGRLPSTRWRPFFVLATATLLSQIILLAFARMDVLNYAEGYGIANPFGLWELTPAREAGVLTLVLFLITGWGLAAYRQPVILMLAVMFVALSWLSAAIGVGGLTLALILLGVVFSVVQRLRQTTGVKLQQIKWMAWSFGLIAFFAAGRVVSGGQTTLLGNVFFAAFTLSWVIAAISLGIALFQYRLYDIDVVIRKTLIYAVVTGLLALIYFSSIILAQILFRSSAGQQSPVIIVLSTLLIAALFSPVRRSVQDVIDRRFYRRKYDAELVLAQFALTARDETDLDALTDELLRVVQETMQPEQVSIWLEESNTKAA